MNQLLLIGLFMLMPFQITATHDADLEQLRQDAIQIEMATRAYRQKKSGAGL